MRRISVLFVCICLFAAAAAAQKQTLQSPDGKITVTVHLGENISWSVSHEQTEVVAPSPLALRLQDGRTWGERPRLKRKHLRSIRQKVEAPFYRKAEIDDVFNELTLDFAGSYGIVFRAYNQGAAYRFTTTEKKELVIENEDVTLNFGADHTVYGAYSNGDTSRLETQFFNSHENVYTVVPVSRLNRSRLLLLPFAVSLGDGKKLCFTEAALDDYPGMYLLNGDGGRSVKGVFAPVPKATKLGGHNLLQQLVIERESYIAKTSGPRSFPWRVLAIASEDRELLDNDLVYLLAEPSRLTDIAWIKPGKVAWEWWNDWNLDGVDFRAGINNETYKYYIDFAARYGIGYVILDEGWSVNLKYDLMQVVPEINVRELVEYGRQRNVGIILWGGYWAVDRDMENVFRHYSEMGVKGFKVDFMDRDDQPMVNFYTRCVETAARYGLLIDFHGTCHPTGLNRTYPNLINYEGVFGLEQLKWSPATVDMVTCDVTMPFIRMLAGPIDYTQGAMRNATRENYFPVNSEPMSQGTRCRQLAEYIVFMSPLNMLCDHPSNYLREHECTQFIASVPPVWDQTVTLDSKIGEYIHIARRKDATWYVGGLTNWTERTVTLDLSFLGEGSYQAELFRDGINADRSARDYKHEVTDLPADRKLTVTMKPGGGFACKLTRK
jgi:alpha-glucosidase